MLHVGELHAFAHCCTFQWELQYDRIPFRSFGIHLQCLSEIIINHWLSSVIIDLRCWEWLLVLSQTICQCLKWKVHCGDDSIGLNLMEVQLHTRRAQFLILLPLFRCSWCNVTFPLKKKQMYKTRLRYFCKAMFLSDFSYTGQSYWRIVCGLVLFLPVAKVLPLSYRDVDMNGAKQK